MNKNHLYYSAFHSQLLSDINKRKEESFILSVVSEIPVLVCEDSMPLELLLWSELWKSICISLERKSESKEEIPANTSRVCTVNYPLQWDQPSQSLYYLPKVYQQIKIKGPTPETVEDFSYLNHKNNLQRKIYKYING